jgi:hypothetical protein
MRCVLLVATIASCEPSPHVHVRVRPPAGVTLDPTRLQVEDDARGERTFTPSMHPALVIAKAPGPGGVDVELGLSIGPRQYVYVRAWYDANGNGVVDAGDLVGEMAPAPFEAHDGGGCSSRDENRAPDIVLAAP